MYVSPNIYTDPAQIGEGNAHRQRLAWPVPRSRFEGDDSSGGNISGINGHLAGRPANHEDSLSDALEGPAADEWSFREPNHSNSVSIMQICTCVMI